MRYVHSTRIIKNQELTDCTELEEKEKMKSNSICMQAAQKSKNNKRIAVRSFNPFHLNDYDKIHACMMKKIQHVLVCVVRLFRVSIFIAYPLQKSKRTPGKKKPKSVAKHTINNSEWSLFPDPDAHPMIGILFSVHLSSAGCCCRFAVLCIGGVLGDPVEAQWKKKKNLNRHKLFDVCALFK